ncbi:MAG: hypothetical protein Q3974_03630 [Rothia sp. (in: high G+C Gram-positive bacteria)]|nr:hypothetical protein [Rothia sp. (in: high G+C Gram-positive bacteria)]
MSFLKNMALLAGGAAAGFIASRVAQPAPQDSAGSELRIRNEYSLSRLAEKEGPVAKFFEIKAGKQLQPFAMKSLQFIARVKQGMDEREAQLNSRFAEQVHDEHPGKLSSWDAELTQNQHPGHASEIIESEALDNDSSSSTKFTRQRIERDRDLGEGFFS